MDFINIRPEDGIMITSSTMRHVSRVIHGKMKDKKEEVGDLLF